MKNIHILPTDKPSRLHFAFEKMFILSVEHTSKSELYKSIPQNIYIISDEEIKPNVYALINGVLCKTELLDGRIVSRQLTGGATMDICKSEYLEIILTTDQDLIQDGVQKIDDEFLEWFVKNPSCESVEIGYGWIRLTETDNEGYWVSIPDKQFEMQQEESKQETLEEAGKNTTKKYINEREKQTAYLEFIEGAKWQQERMYSEEEVKQFAFECVANFLSNNDNKVEIKLVDVIIDRVNDKFEQFKNK